MPGLDLLMDPVPLARESKRAFVFAYDRTAAPGSRYAPLPHIRLLDVTRHEGAQPWSARFAYALDDAVLAYYFPTMPARIEQIFGEGASSPWKVEMGDRLVAFEYDPELPDLGPRMIFDGFAELPQVDLSGEAESATFTAKGTPIRCWDEVIEYAPFRDVNQHNTEGKTTDLEFMGVWRFNPESVGNRTLADVDEFDGEPHAYPVFLDHRAPSSRRQRWDLAGAARALCWFNNFNEDFVKNPTSAEMEGLLVARVPVEAGGPIDDEDEDTYKVEDIILPDLDYTGQCWPDALWDLLSKHNFTYRWQLEVTPDGDPDWSLVFARKDEATPIKEFKLQPPYGAWDGRYSNVGSLSLARDGDLANVWASLTRPVAVELGVVLAPLFTPVAADKDNPDTFREGSTDFDPVKYRKWGLDEQGLGHATKGGDAPGSAWGAQSTTPTALGDALVVGDDFPSPPHAIRPRPGTGELLTLGADGKPIKAQLAVSRDYKGPVPGVWDGTGTWQVVTGGGWRLLADQLGVALTDPDPQRWSIGDPVDMDQPPVPGGVVNILTWTAAPTADNPKVYLRLTTVIEADIGIGRLPKVIADYRLASSQIHEIRRVDDTRERFRLDVVHKSSPFQEQVNQPSDVGQLNADFKAVRDDREKLAAHLAARRRAHELATVIGTVTIPTITHAYALGDRAKGVTGRGVSFRMNVPFDPKESPVYPVISGISWTYHGRQQTVIHLSDRRSETNQ